MSSRRTGKPGKTPGRNAARLPTETASSLSKSWSSPGTALGAPRQHSVCHIPSPSPPPPSSQQSRPRTHRCYAAKLAHARARRGEGKAHCVLRIYILRSVNKNTKILIIHGDTHTHTQKYTRDTGGAVNYPPSAESSDAGRTSVFPWFIHAQILQVSYDLQAINTGDKQPSSSGQNQASTPPPMTPR